LTTKNRPKFRWNPEAMELPSEEKTDRGRGFAPKIKELRN